MPAPQGCSIRLPSNWELRLFAPKPLPLSTQQPSFIHAVVGLGYGLCTQKFFEKTSRSFQLYLASQLGIEIRWVTLIRMSHMG